MKFKSLVLVGLVFISLFLAVFCIYRAGSEKEQIEQNTRQLLLFDPDEVDELTVENVSGKVVCQKSDGGRWRIVEPVEVDASQQAVEAVVVNLARARVNRFVVQGDEVDGEALKKYGLEPPHVKVSIRIRGRALGAIAYGDTTPSGDYVYFKRTSEDKIGLVELYRRTGVDRNFADLRNRNVLKFKWVEARALRLESPGAAIELAKVGKEWQLRSPVASRGDREEIELLLQRLSAKMVQEFVEDVPKSLQSYGLDPPRRRLEVTMEDGGVRSLWIGGAKEGGFYYAKDVSMTSVFALDSAFVNQFDRSIFDLTYKKLVEFKREDVDRVEFAYPDSSMLCVRAQSVWVAVPQKRPLKGYELDAILFNLEKLKAEKFLTQAPEDTAQYGLEPPHLKISLWVGDHLAGDLSIGNTAGDLVYAKGSGNGFTCLVKKAIADRLRPEPERIFARE